MYLIPYDDLFTNIDSVLDIDICYLHLSFSLERNNKIFKINVTYFVVSCGLNVSYCNGSIVDWFFLLKTPCSDTLNFSTNVWNIKIKLRMYWKLYYIFYSCYQGVGFSLSCLNVLWQVLSSTTIRLSHSCWYILTLRRIFLWKVSSRSSTSMALENGKE